MVKISKEIMFFGLYLQVKVINIHSHANNGIKSLKFYFANMTNFSCQNPFIRGNYAPSTDGLVMVSSRHKLHSANMTFDLSRSYNMF